MAEINPKFRRSSLSSRLGSLRRSILRRTIREAAMPTYIVGDIHISDPASYQAHLPRALATIARFGGRVVAGGGKIDLLEGDPMPEGIFIIEFPSTAAARRWYQSDDHQ